MRRHASILSIALLLTITPSLLPTQKKGAMTQEVQTVVLQADTLLAHSQQLIEQFVPSIERIAQRIEQEELTEIPEYIPAENQQEYGDMVEAYMCFLVGMCLFRVEAACMTDGQIESLVGNLWLSLAGPFQLFDKQAQIHALQEAKKWIANHQDDEWHIPAEEEEHFKPEDECLAARAESISDYFALLDKLIEKLS